MNVVGEVVGREREQAAIASFLEATHSGARAFVVEGEAGIGKTTLLRVAIETLAADRATVLYAAPAEAETALSFAGLRDLLEPVAEDVIDALPEPQRRALDAALLRARPAKRVDRPALAAAVLGALRRLASGQPVVLAIDDVQWLDAGSANVVSFALRRLSDEPVSVLASRRSGVRARLLESLSGDVQTRLALRPLSANEIDRLVRGRCGPMRASVLRRIREASGGNAFFALELARAVGLADDGDDPDEVLALPDTLDLLVRTRLGRLSKGARRYCLVAAVMAEPTNAALRRMFEKADQLLDEAVALDVVQLHGERLNFAHPLLPSGLYAQATPGERRRAHACAADATWDLEQRALHRAHAAQSPDETLARDLDQAADRAAARGAVEAAAALVAHAVALTPGEDDRRRRLVAQADHATTAGDHTTARAILEPLVEQSQGAQQVELLYRLALASDDGAPILERALAAQPEPAQVARVRGELSRLEMLALRWERAAEHAAAAVAAAEELGTSAELVAALVRLGQIELNLGVGDALATLRRALEVEGSVGLSVPLRVSPARVLGIALTHHDKLDESRAWLLEALERGRAAGETWRVAVLMNLAELECRAGAWSTALAYAREAEQLTHGWGLEGAEGPILAARAWVHAHLGEVAEARASAERGRALSEAEGNVFFALRSERVLGFIDVSLGDYEAAARRLVPVVERVEAAGAREPSLLAVAPNAIEALLGIGRVEQAERLLLRLEAQGRSLDRPWALANAARYRALLEAEKGDGATASEALARAFEQHKRLPDPFERGRTLLAAGTIMRRAKRRAEARKTLDEAHDVFMSLGARLWSERAAAELARTGLRRTRGDDLTPTEAQVARLAAEGMTNSQIARTLFMSVKTVEWNLSKVYGKLGVRSKPQLANRVAHREQAGASPLE